MNIQRSKTERSPYKGNCVASQSTTQFTGYFLHRLCQQGRQGFTLIELLTVLIIIGVLVAIAMPSFLNQASKAKQAEAKQNVSSMNRGQQAFVTENASFASDLSSLGLGIKSSTDHYTYSTGQIDTSGAYSLAVAKSVSIKGYAGVVYLVNISGGGDATSEAIMCETDSPTIAITVPSSSSCPLNSSPL